MAPKRTRQASQAASSSAAPALKEWEREEPAWERESGSEDEGDGDEVSDTEVGPAEAQQELLSFMIDRHQKGKLTGKDMCIISFWCGRAGLSEVAALGMRPRSSSGNHQRHVDGYMQKRLGKDMPEAYSLPMPVFDRASGERDVQDVVVLPPHELLVRELVGVDVSAMVARWSRTPNYGTHPVVQKMEAEGIPTVPLAVYLDGVQYAVRGSMLVVSITNLCTDKQHVIGVIRKRKMCGLKAGCGCKGWCSLHAFWVFLRWSLAALGVATYPAARHNTELDSDKLNEAGWRGNDAPRQAKRAHRCRLLVLSCRCGPIGVRWRRGLAQPTGARGQTRASSVRATGGTGWTEIFSHSTSPAWHGHCALLRTTMKPVVAARL